MTDIERHDNATFMFITLLFGMTFVCTYFIEGFLKELLEDANIKSVSESEDSTNESADEDSTDESEDFTIDIKLTKEKGSATVKITEGGNIEKYEETNEGLHMTYEAKFPKSQTTELKEVNNRAAIVLDDNYDSIEVDEETGKTYKVKSVVIDFGIAATTFTFKY